MGNVKTAISMQRSLFEQLEELAHELKTSRSHLIALALEEFIRRHESKQLLESINAAFDEGPASSEEILRRGMRKRHRQIVEGQW